MSTKREGKFIRILKTYSCSYWMEKNGRNFLTIRHEMGPVLPMYRCLKFKWMQPLNGKGNPGLSLKLQWEITLNDPRFAAIKAITDLTPNRASPYDPERKYKDQWEFAVDEYRSIAGREGQELASTK